MLIGMIMRPSTIRWAVLAAGLTLAAAMPGPGAHAQSAVAATPATAAAAPLDGARTWRYAVNWGPAALAELSVTLTEGLGETVMSGDGQGAGLLLLFSDFELSQTGRYGPEGPREFTASSRVGDKRTNRRVTFAPGQTPVTETLAAPADDNEPRSPIPEGALIGAVDPMFPILSAMRKLDAGGDCAGDHRVYTGRSAFQMTLRDLGPEVLTADRDWTFSGPAHRCSVSLARIGGFRLKSNWWDQDEADVTRDIWFAALPGGTAPVRMQIEWPLGYAVGRIDLR
ncbi:MAG: hypothetical protein ACJAVR_000768 [Paracoccaceae bacterium]|jgi:hypothetical protein